MNTSKRAFSFSALLFSLLLAFQSCAKFNPNGFTETKKLFQKDEVKKLNGEVDFSANLQIANVSSPAKQVELLKTKSCMFDGLIVEPVSGATSDDFNSNIEVLSRSNCEFLPRAIETWEAPPNFKLIEKNLNIVRKRTNKNYVYGMFISEAIATKKIYKDDFGKAFDFEAMCVPGTQDHWRTASCIPNVAHAEYQRYIFYIVEKAMVLGVRDFTFGQLGHVDPRRVMPSVIDRIRNIAERLGAVITIGGQPNGIMREDYLRKFDYVITPSYIDDVTPAQVRSNEYGQCKAGTNCQAIYFHPSLVGISNAVIAEVDWFGRDDDAHRLGKKTKEERHRYIYELSQALKEKGVGFILPFRIWYNYGALGGCFGQNTYLYSASNEYKNGCGDEDAWNAILAGRAPSLAVSNGSFTTSTTSDAGSEAEMDSEPNIIPVVTAASMTEAQARSVVLSLYISILGRTPAEALQDSSGVNYWTQKLMSGTKEATIVAQLKSSDEHFVRSQYLSILKRKADAAGLSYFQNALANGSKSRQGVINDLTHFCVNHVGGECM